MCLNLHSFIIPLFLINPQAQNLNQGKCTDHFCNSKKKKKIHPYIYSLNFSEQNCMVSKENRFKVTLLHFCSIAQHRKEFLLLHCPNHCVKGIKRYENRILCFFRAFYSICVEYRYRLKNFVQNYVLSDKFTNNIRT